MFAQNIMREHHPTSTLALLRTLTDNLTSSNPFTALVAGIINSRNSEEEVDVSAEHEGMQRQRGREGEVQDKNSKSILQEVTPNRTEEKKQELRVQPSKPQVFDGEIEWDVDLPEHLNLNSHMEAKPGDQNESIQRQVSQPHIKPAEPVILNGSDTVAPSSLKSQSLRQAQPLPIKRQHSSQLKNLRKISSGESSVNLELTLKSKNTRNLSNTQNRADSVIYSDATLGNSNSTFQFLQQKQAHLQSHRSVLEKEPQNILKMERAVSRQLSRHEQDNTEEETESRKLSESAIDKRSQGSSERKKQETHEEDGKERRDSEELKSSREKQYYRKSTEGEEGVFQTEIKEYKSKIARIRDMKQQKKRKLQAELKKINQQIQGLTRKGTEQNLQKGGLAKYESRVKISDNIQAKLKAEKLVKQLKQEKKERKMAHLGDLHIIDKNINHYMEEITLERVKNEERIKQRKKIEIIERMKQQEMRKIEEEQQKNKNLQFLAQLKHNQNSKQGKHPASSVEEPKYSLISDPRSELKKSRENRSGVKERSITKASQKLDFNEMTPELSRKKEFLKNVRNLKFKRDKVDVYEQALN